MIRPRYMESEVQQPPRPDSNFGLARSLFCSSPSLDHTHTHTIRLARSRARTTPSLCIPAHHRPRRLESAHCSPLHVDPPPPPTTTIKHKKDEHRHGPPSPHHSHVFPSKLSSRNLQGPEYRPNRYKNGSLLPLDSVAPTVFICL